METVRNKRECVTMMMNGSLGNAAVSCRTPEEMGGFPEVTCWGLRSFNPRATFKRLGMSPGQIVQHFKPGMYYSESFGTDKLLCQGEFAVIDGLVMGRFTETDFRALRFAIETADHMTFKSGFHLRHFLNLKKSGWGDEIEELIFRFPGHVVETSALKPGVRKGIYRKGWLVWEVRKY